MMGEFSELIKSFHDSTKERFKNPLIGTFTLTFLIYNWRAFYVLLFSDTTAEARIEMVEENYSNWDSILIPIIIALFYVLILPEINSLIDRQLKKVTMDRITQKNEIQIHRLEAKGAIFQIEFTNNQIKSGNRDINDLNEKLKSQQLLIDNLNRQNKTAVDNYQQFMKTSRENEDSSQKIINDLKNRLDEKKIESSQTDQLSEIIELAHRNDRNIRAVDLILMSSNIDLTELSDEVKDKLFDVFVKAFVSNDVYVPLKGAAKELMEYYIYKELIDTEKINFKGDISYKIKLTNKGNWKEGK